MAWHESWRQISDAWKQDRSWDAEDEGVQAAAATFGDVDEIQQQGDEWQKWKPSSDTWSEDSSWSRYRGVQVEAGMSIGSGSAKQDGRKGGTSKPTSGKSGRMAPLATLQEQGLTLGDPTLDELFHARLQLEFKEQFAERMRAAEAEAVQILESLPMEAQLSLGEKGAKHLLQYKVHLCPEWKRKHLCAGQCCSKGPRCTFAHGEDELLCCSVAERLRAAQRAMEKLGSDPVQECTGRWSSADSWQGTGGNHLEQPSVVRSSADPCEQPETPLASVTTAAPRQQSKAVKMPESASQNKNGKSSKPSRDELLAQRRAEALAAWAVEISDEQQISGMQEDADGTQPVGFGFHSAPCYNRGTDDESQPWAEYRSNTWTQEFQPCGLPASIADETSVQGPTVALREHAWSSREAQSESNGLQAPLQEEAWPSWEQVASSLERSGLLCHDGASSISSADFTNS